MDIRINKRIVIIGSVAGVGVLLVVAAFLLIKGVGDLNMAKMELETVKSRIASFASDNPFPSEANVKREKKNAQYLKRWFKDLSDLMREGQVASVQRRPTIFMTQLEKKKGELQKIARKNGVKWPDGFSFGFEQYFKDPQLPPPDDVPVLTQQLMISEALCKVLFEENIDGVIGFEREVFELSNNNKSNSSRRSNRRVSGRPGQQRSQQENRKRPGVLEKGDLHAVLRFVLVFEAKEAAFLRVVNRLAVHEQFFMVTDVDTKSIFTEDKYKFNIPANTDADVSGLYRDERVVLGPNLEVPMKVTLGIDVYKFPEND